MKNEHSKSTAKSAESAWASLQGVAAVEIAPLGHPVAAEIALPGSKSETNRALILAACADGVSHLRGILRSDDSYWCLTALQQLGAKVDDQNATISIEGTAGKWRQSAEPLFIGSAGTIARFLPGVLCAGDGHWTLRGSEQLSGRPIKALIDALTTLGGDIQYAEEFGRLPIEINGRKLAGGAVQMSGAVSSQFISGALMASPLAVNPVEIEITDEIVQPGYVTVTTTMMKKFGVDVEADQGLRHFNVQPQMYRATTMDVAADASTASYFMALAAITNGEIVISNLDFQSGQPDIQFLQALERLGCEVKGDQPGVLVRSRGRLRGNQVFDMKPMSDVTLTLAAMAPFADGPITIVGVEHIRFHESDRISAMAKSLSLLGIKVEERRDGLTIWPGRPKIVELDTYEDHRVAMSLAILGAAADGIVLRDPGCVSKTCPTFFSELAKLGVSAQFR